GAVRGQIRDRADAAPVSRGREARGAVLARSADRRTSRRSRGRVHPRAAAAPRGQTLRSVPRRRGQAGARHLDAAISLPIMRRRDDAVLPARAYAGDAGLDLSACDEHELGPGERATVATGLAVAIPDGYAGFVQPRSGLAAEHGITIVNSPGLVDSGYRGELR